jgi:hypothetical protein
MCGRSFYRRRHTFEPYRQVLELPVAETFVQKLSECVVGVQMGAMAGQRAELPEYRTAEDAPGGESRPHVNHAIHRFSRRFGGQERPVESAHARPDDQIRSDAALQEGTQHAHLCCTEDAATSEHKGGPGTGRHPARMARPRGDGKLPPAGPQGPGPWFTRAARGYDSIEPPQSGRGDPIRKEVPEVSPMRSTLHDVARNQGLSVPLPGAGRTPERFDVLSDCASADLSVGRLVEGHLDAVAILSEAGQPVSDSDVTYGVWAARSSSGGVTAVEESDGWYLAGSKAFCSGSTLLDRALVTADTADGYRLFDIDIATQVVAVAPHSWPAVGMADSQSETLEFGGPAVPPARAIGGPGFYLERPGFWHGAIGVAACWYGGAAGLVTHLLRTVAPESGDAVLAELGHAVAHVGAMRRLIADAAEQIDADPTDKRQQARTDALTVRHAVHHGARAVLEHVAAAGGARPLCHDPAQARRAADLYVYLAQHHGPQDAVALGRAALSDPPWN